MKRKNIFKSLLAAAMALIMIFGAAPLSGFVGIRLPMLSLKAEAATTEDRLFEYELDTYWTGSDHRNGVRITRYKGPDSGEVVIPKTIEGYEVKWIGGAWQDKVFQGYTGIASIVIPDSVISIDRSAFSGCTSLAEITVSPDNKNYSSVDGVLFNKDGSELIIYPKGNGRSAYTVPDGVTSISGSAFSGCTSLKEIVIPDSVTTIGSSAFEGCTSLSKVKLSNNLRIIQERTFYDCTSLAEIVIPDSVTEIGVSAFLGCTSLSKVKLPKNLTSINSDVFYGCTSLAEITIPDSVTSIGGYAFSGCTSLAEIAIPDSVTSIGGYAFSGCTSLAEITIPDSVTSIGDSAFSGCTSLAEITIPDSVTKIGNDAFYRCTSLSKVKLSNNLRIIQERTFSGCTSLAEIVIPDSVTEIRGRIDSEYYGGAFIGCTSLSKVKLSNNLAKIGMYTFSDCTSLKDITIPDSVTSIDGCAFYGCTSLAEIAIPDSVTSIGGSAFSGCTSLADITIPDSVTEIGSSAFEGCTSLSKVNLPKKLTTIEIGIFRDCTSLAEIDIPDSVTSIGGAAFSGCTSLTEIDIPDSVTSIGGYAFKGCTSLSKVDLPKNLTMIEGYTFSGCSSLESIIIPDGVTAIGTWNEHEISYGNTLYGNTFSGCTSLKEIIIPDSVIKILDHAFSNCTSLESITIGSGVESLGDEWIASCRRLENITVSPENKTYSSVDGVLFNKDKSELSAYPIGNKRSSYTIPDGVKKIGKKAFYGCRYIESLTIPVSVAEIEASALGNCYDIRAVYYLGTREQWKEVVIGADNYMFALVNVRCADDSQCRHVWGEWEVVEEATYEKDGLERRVCSLCKAEQTRKIPRLGAVKVDAIELSESEKKLNVGKSFTITATVKPDNAWNRTVTWSSSDPSIATVDENGTVTAIAEGEAIITAESADGVTAECKVTVEKKESFGKKLLNVITAPFRAIINLFKKLFGK